jgi:hypothetical protein
MQSKLSSIVVTAVEVITSALVIGLLAALARAVVIH